MALIHLEVQMVAEAQVESRLGRMVGMATNIKDADGPSPYINGGPRLLKIDESKFSVGNGKEG